MLLRRYQRLCGALLYASTNTRPDIAFSTGMLCRAMGRPIPELLEAALRVLGYLYRNRHIGLRYEASSKSLEGFSDSVRLGRETLYLGFHVPPRLRDGELVVKETDIGCTVLVRGRDHCRLRSRQRGYLPIRGMVYSMYTV